MDGYVCKSCGAVHDEVPTCFISAMPSHVHDVAPEERARRVELTSDQCVIDGEHFFIIGNLDILIQGSDESLRWTVWSSLSERNFLRASELWESAGRESEPPYFGWLSNLIPGYSETLNLKVLVHTQPLGLRPVLELLEQDHPLFLDQRDGIARERARELVHAAIHSGEPAA